jgi:di/tricarboxylate transporter
VGVAVALAGGLYLFLASGRLLGRENGGVARAPRTEAEALELAGAEGGGGQPGRPEVFATPRPFRPVQAMLSLIVFVGVVAFAALHIAPIAAAAFAGAVLLVLLRVISADQAYRGLRPQILLLIAGMVVLGLALEQTGLATAATDALVGSMKSFRPLTALILLYGATLFLTELLSNATVAVLVTPVAVALADSLGVDSRPFLVAVMMAASAAFATPFGYQTNVIVYQMGGYRYTDFVRVGLPLNLITWAVAIAAIAYVFPF